MRSFSSVFSDMFSQITFCNTGMITVMACKWPFSCMSPHVDIYTVLSVSTVRTQVALMDLLYAFCVMLSKTAACRNTCHWLDPIAVLHLKMTLLSLLLFNI